MHHRPMYAIWSNTYAKRRMKSKLYVDDFNEVLIERNYPLNYTLIEEGVIEKKFKGELFGIQGYSHDIYLENFRISYADMILPNNLSLYFDSDFETVEMCFILNGDLLMRDFETNNELIVNANRHNLLYTSCLRGKTEMNKISGMRFFEVNMNVSFFKKYLPLNKTCFKHFLNKIKRKESCCFSENGFVITVAMYQIIREILNCNRQGIYKKMFLESKIIELLMLQLEQFGEDQSSAYTLKKNQIEQMYAVKEILQNNTSTYLSLTEISKRVGTNEYTLKKGFKEVFGQTVFGYWNELKMTQAKILLLDLEKTVSEVSELMGYKHPQHFSTAFKKKFGVAPRNLHRL